MGSRLGFITQRVPKPLLRVGGKPMLQRVIERVAEAGAKKIVVNVHHLAPQIVSFIKSQDWGVEILISDETSQLLDTGGGIVKAAKLLTAGQDILVHNSDIVTDFSLTELINAHQPDATLLVQDRPSSRKLAFDNAGLLLRRDPNGLAFNGIHILSPEAIEKLKIFSRTQPPAFSIMDFYLNSGVKIHGYQSPNIYNWIDAGKPETLAQAQSLFQA